MYGTIFRLGTWCRQKSFLNAASDNTPEAPTRGIQSTKRALPTSCPPALLWAKWTHPRRVVAMPRISQVFRPDRRRSSHSFLTMSARFSDRRIPLRWPPRLPERFFTRPRRRFPPLFLPYAAAWALKHRRQNFARGDGAERPQVAQAIAPSDTAE